MLLRTNKGRKVALQKQREAGQAITKPMSEVSKLNKTEAAKWKAQPTPLNALSLRVCVWLLAFPFLAGPFSSWLVGFWRRAWPRPAGP